jgi:hypothetical protein
MSGAGAPWLPGSDQSRCCHLPCVHDDCRSLVIYKGACQSPVRVVTGHGHCKAHVREAGLNEAAGAAAGELWVISGKVRLG